MVKGVEQLRARFRRIPQNLQAEIERTMETQAKKIVADMKRLVRVDKGALRDSIGWTWGDVPSGAMTIGTVAPSRREQIMAIKIYAGTRDKSLGDRDAFYGVFQEFGTQNMAANPFFWPTWRRSRTRVKSAMSRALRKAIDAS